MQKLINLKWSPKWVSHLGCIKGCLDYLGVEISDAWLFGGTGHAFIINMSNNKDSCPSGPTAWKTMKLFELGENLGYQVDGLFGSKYEEDLSSLQQRAWEFARTAIDGGLPCYGWELEVPEFYVVYGYDESGYYYSGPGCDDGKGPKPWKELGDSEIGVIEMYSVKSGDVSEDSTIICEALSLALEHAQNPEKWIFPNYRSGLAGYEAWIRAVENGSAIRMGLAYNAAVWEECRRFGVEFLKEAKQRLGNEHNEVFDDAISHYEIVAEHLKEITALYPFGDLSEAPIGVNQTSQTAAEALKSANEAEAAGLQALESILAAL